MKKIKNFYYGSKDTIDTSFYWISLLMLVTIPYYIYKGGDYLIWGKENISLVFISLAGIAKGFMDTVQFHFDKSKFSHLNKYYYDPEFSWLNKYEEKNRVDFVRKKFKIKIPYLVWIKGVGVRVKCVEIGTPINKFVAFTDFWHLVQSFHINFIVLTVSIGSIFEQTTHGFLFDFLTYSFLYRAFFFIFYKYFLIKK